MRKVLFTIVLSLLLCGCGKDKIGTDVTPVLSTEDKILSTEFNFSLDDMALSVVYPEGSYEVARMQHMCYYKFTNGENSIFYQVDCRKPSIYQTVKQGMDVKRTVALLSKNLGIEELTQSFINDNTVVKLRVNNLKNVKFDIDKGTISMYANVTTTTVAGDKATNSGNLVITDDLSRIVSYTLEGSTCSTITGTTSLMKDETFLKTANVTWDTLTQTAMLELFKADITVGILDMLSSLSNTVQDSVDTEVEESSEIDLSETWESNLPTHVVEYNSFDNVLVTGLEARTATEFLISKDIAILISNGDSSQPVFNYGRVLSNSEIDYDGYIVCKDIWSSYLTEDCNEDLEPIHDAASISYIYAGETYYASLIKQDNKVIGVLFQLTAESIDNIS